MQLIVQDLSQTPVKLRCAGRDNVLRQHKVCELISYYLHRSNNIKRNLMCNLQVIMRSEDSSSEFGAGKDFYDWKGTFGDVTGDHWLG